MAAAAIRPVETFREHATALEAALVECLSGPKPKVVHALRTYTRRIEAQLLLLEEMLGLPPIEKEAAKLRRQLKSVRRAAGHARDLDVQRKLLKSKQGDPKAARDLRAMLKRRRQRRKDVASRLLRQVKKRREKLAGAFQKLLRALRPATNVELGVADLLEIVDKQFLQHPKVTLGGEPTADQLHTLRKAAKVARYLAENAPGSKRAKRTAAHYEAVQQAGGEWHDLNVLEEEASEELGGEHVLTKEFAGDCERSLRRFLEMLQPLRNAQGGTSQEERFSTVRVAPDVAQQ